MNLKSRRGVVLGYWLIFADYEAGGAYRGGENEKACKNVGEAHHYTFFFNETGL